MDADKAVLNNNKTRNVRQT